MIVKAKEIPVRHNGNRHLPGEEFEIDRKAYDRIHQHLEVVEEDKSDDDKPLLSELTIPQLKEFADKHKIDLGDAKTKPEILVKIQASGDGDGN